MHRAGHTIGRDQVARLMRRLGIRGVRKGKQVDAIAARAVQSGAATTTPKAGGGPVEAIRALHLTRRSAVKARTQTANQLHALVVTAPDDMRADLRGLSIA